MEYEELQALAVSIMSADVTLYTEAENWTGTPTEAFVLGAILGAGFDEPDVASDFLLMVSTEAGLPFETFERVRNIADASVAGFDPYKMLEATSELSTLESIMVGICFGGGFVGSVEGFRAIASLSEIAGIGYSDPLPRGQYRAPLPDWITGDCEEV
jgi:hypothetical protein